MNLLNQKGLVVICYKEEEGKYVPCLHKGLCVTQRLDVEITFDTYYPQPSWNECWEYFNLRYDKSQHNAKEQALIDAIIEHDQSLIHNQIQQIIETEVFYSN